MSEIKSSREIASFFAGTIAGATGILVGHPLDTLKVRYQTGQISSNLTINRKYILDLYRGILPPLLTSGSVQSINFSLYEFFKKKLKTEYLRSHLSAVFCSGTISGKI